MTISFLGQGYERESDNAVGKLLIQYLKRTDFRSFTGISAFASEAGIFGLSGHILSAKQNFENLSLIVGIDQEGTSKEALDEILKLKIDSYIFYQSEPPIFHPKIYLFEGEKDNKLILGSSNLTVRGLFTNTESSLLLEFDADDEEGSVLLEQLKSYYKPLFEFNDPNLFKITPALIAEFVSKGIVPNELERKRIYSRKNVGATNTSIAETAMVIPKRDTAKIPASFPIKPGKTIPISNLSQIIDTNLYSPTEVNPVDVADPGTGAFVTSSEVQAKELVWKKRALSQSDAQQVPSGTAVTANLKLSQARFRVDGMLIDQTTYFRDIVFNNLPWVKTKANNDSYEEAFCLFDIKILGDSISAKTLKLSHDPVRIAGQGNTPTWLHWGNDLLPILQQTDIRGKTLNLFREDRSFSIEIVEPE
jgi:HKD family nuclease